MTWTTKDGDRIPITGLSDRHLLNIVNFLVKRANHEYLLCRQRALAPLDWTVVAQFMSKKDHKRFVSLVREARKRGLLPDYSAV